MYFPGYPSYPSCIIELSMYDDLDESIMVSFLFFLEGGGLSLSQALI